jgi:large subunit ribosomal protein L24
MSRRQPITPKRLRQITRSRDKTSELLRRGDLIPAKSWNIFRGDKVQIIRENYLSKFKTKDLGKVGVVKKVIRKKNLVVVEGVHLRKRYSQPTESKQGSSYFTESPVHYSALQLIDPILGRPTRIYRAYTEAGEKVRQSVLTGAIIPKPGLLPADKEQILAKKVPNLRADTPQNLARAQSFKPLDYAAINSFISAVRAEKTKIRLEREAKFNENPKLRKEWEGRRRQVEPSPLEADKSKRPDGMQHAIGY